MRILLANPRGFCAGVRRAISIVERALEIYGKNVYVKNEIVHNRYVVNSLINRGVIFVKNISEVPDKSVLIFSAHGVSKAVRTEVKHRNLILFDATCPLVTKVHVEVAQASRNGKEAILIGHSGHPEVEGTIGQYDNPLGGIYLVESPEDVWRIHVKNANHLCFMTQTTLSSDETDRIVQALYARFPKITGPYKSDICFATINRQTAVRNLARYVDALLIVGSANSSNANRLLELAWNAKKPAYMIDNPDDIQKNWTQNVRTIGVTASASTPDVLVHGAIERLFLIGASSVQELSGPKEDVVFNIPKSLTLKI